MFKELPIIVPMYVASALTIGLMVNQYLVAMQDEPTEQAIQEALDAIITDAPLRRSKKVHRPTFSDDYIVYLQEHMYDIGDVSDPTTYKEAIISP